MKQLRIMAAALFLISPFAAHGMFIEVTVEGTAHNYYGGAYLPDVYGWEYFLVSGSFVLEFSTADDTWIEGYYQYPTLHSFAFELSAYHHDPIDMPDEFLASDSCTTGSGVGSFEGGPVIKNPDWPDEPYYLDYLHFWCGTPDSEFWVDPYELDVNFFDIGSGITNESVWIDSTFISEPGTLALLCAGLIGMGFALRRDRA